MKLVLSNLTIAFLLISFVSFGQNSASVASRFFNFLNKYQRDSLEMMLADDFLLSRTYTKYANDKSSFLDMYLKFSKAYNGKFRTLEVIGFPDSSQFLVEDQSDYLMYLNVKYPTWKITFTTKGEKIERVVIDTTETYQRYLADIKVADELFTTWLSAHYPLETKEILLDREGLLVKRLKEYAQKKK